MYNTDNLPHLLAFQKALFGNLNPRNLPSGIAYSLPPNIEMVPCEENGNGEWVPINGLEKSASS